MRIRKNSSEGRPRPGSARQDARTPRSPIARGVLEPPLLSGGGAAREIAATQALECLLGASSVYQRSPSKDQTSILARVLKGKVEGAY